MVASPTPHSRDYFQPVTDVLTEQLFNEFESVALKENFSYEH